MAFRKQYKRKTAYAKDEQLRVKNSYYTFSKEYPGKTPIKVRKTNRKRKNKTAKLKIILLSSVFIMLSVLAYFCVSLGFSFSYKAETTPETSYIAEESTENVSSALDSKTFKALYLPYNKISDEKYLKKFIGKIERKDADSVVIDFKMSDGHLLYSSKVQLAMLSKCAVFDNETVRKAINIFKSSGIGVIARIYCFEDPMSAIQNNGEMAVKYMNSDVVWLDDSAENNGKAWLNPYSEEAKKYLIDIITEVSEKNVDGIILESVSFPDKGATDSAGYPGEKSKSERTKQLLQFIEEVKGSLPDDCFLLVSQTATDTLSGNETKYFGSIAANAADGICVDTSVRPDGYTVDKKTDFSSALSLLTELKAKINTDKKLLPIIHMDEYSYKYIRFVKRSGYESYILYDESAEY